MSSFAPFSSAEPRPRLQTSQELLLAKQEELGAMSYQNSTPQFLQPPSILPRPSLRGVGLVVVVVFEKTEDRRGSSRVRIELPPSSSSFLLLFSSPPSPITNSQNLSISVQTSQLNPSTSSFPSTTPFSPSPPSPSTALTSYPRTPVLPPTRFQPFLHHMHLLLLVLRYHLEPSRVHPKPRTRSTQSVGLQRMLGSAERDDEGGRSGGEAGGDGRGGEVGMGGGGFDGEREEEEEAVGGWLRRLGGRFERFLTFSSFYLLSICPFS